MVALLSERASGALRVWHRAGAVVPDPFVFSSQPSLPGGALDLLTTKPAFFVESGVVGSRQRRSSGQRLPL